MQLTAEFKQRVRSAILVQRENMGGTDSDYAKKIGIKPAIYSRLKKGELDKIIADTVWIAHRKRIKCKNL